MGKKCIVPGCKSGIIVPSHKFPKDPTRCAKWIESLQLNNFKSYTTSEMQIHKVCYKHFQKKDYTTSRHNRTLLTTAVPVPFETFDERD